MTIENHESMLFRFKGLIHAIEFFSQRFGREQIINYAIDFVEELLIVDKVAVFVEKEGYFVPVKQRVYNIKDYKIEATEAIKDIVVLHAGLFYKDDIKQLFPKSLHERFNSRLGIPLIIDRHLYGFILIDRSDKNKDFDEDDIAFATALMNLFYTALTNYDAYNELNDVKKILDEKIFTLFAINQSSKVLLGTLEIDKICNLAVSVLSELTQSSLTSIFLYDDLSEVYRLMAIQNVHQFDQECHLLALQRDGCESICTKSYYDLTMDEDEAVFLNAFHNAPMIIKELKPKSLIPLSKNGTHIGFVTLGERVNEEPYGESVIELSEGLASFLYVAISNAKQVKIIREQKMIIDSKLQSLTTLNHLIKNINSSSSLDNMFTIVAQTLELSLKVSCGVLAKYDESSSSLIAVRKIGCDSIHEQLPLDEKISRLKSGKILLANSIGEAKELFGEPYMENIEGYYSGAIVIPVYIDKFETEFLGAVVIFDIEGQIISDNVNSLLFESMCNAIAPIWYQLGQMAFMKENYVVNGTTRFKEELKKEIQMSNDFDLDLYVLLVHHKVTNCLETAKFFPEIVDDYRKSYKIDNSHMMIIVNIKEEHERLKATLPLDYTAKCFTFREDFDDYDGFVKKLDKVDDMK